MGNGWNIFDKATPRQRKAIKYLSSQQDVRRALSKSDAAIIVALLIEAKEKCNETVYEKQKALLERIGNVRYE